MSKSVKPSVSFGKPDLSTLKDFDPWKNLANLTLPSCTKEQVALLAVFTLGSVALYGLRQGKDLNFDLKNGVFSVSKQS